MGEDHFSFYVGAVLYCRLGYIDHFSEMQQSPRTGEKEPPRGEYERKVEGKSWYNMLGLSYRLNVKTINLASTLKNSRVIQ